MNIIDIQLSNQIALKKEQLPIRLQENIRAYLTLDNPQYLNAQKHGYYLGGIAPKIYCYHEDPVYLYAYRGYIGSLIPYICQAGFKYRITDQRRRLPEVNFTFYGELREYQIRATMEALQKHFGILVSPCGSGKTVMGLRILAERRQPTIILVYTKELLNQWIDRINQYLGIPKDEVGIIGGGKESIGPVTVAMVQTLVKRDLPEISKHFGFLIVDECHRAPSMTFTQIITAFNSYFMLGLSATPYRRDKLNKLIYATLGNVVARITDQDLEQAGTRIRPEVIARETRFYYNYQEDSDYVPMIHALVEDVDRNNLIVEDVIYESKESGNFLLILSDRKAHCESLASLLRGQGIDCAVLTGDISGKRREAIIQQLEDGSLRVVLATGSLAGEGLDIPRLNRIFITTPIRWKGRVKQYIGRALRACEGKADARIYDYLDSKVGVLMNSYKTRCYTVYDGLN